MSKIVLIGPMGAGKSSVADALSAGLSIRRVPLDAVRWGYYYQMGFDLRDQERTIERDGPIGRFNYWKPFEAFAVERVIADYPGTVIDFGAGHSVHEDDELLARVRAALSVVKHTILLLPSPDKEEAIRILNLRIEAEADSVDGKLNAHFVRHPSNSLLATHTVYDEGRTAAQTADEIIAFV